MKSIAGFFIAPDPPVPFSSRSSSAVRMKNLFFYFPLDRHTLPKVIERSVLLIESGNICVSARSAGV
jgi:hypothetical protein